MHFDVIGCVLFGVFVSDKGNSTSFHYLRPCRVIGRRLLQMVLRSPNKYTAGVIKRYSLLSNSAMVKQELSSS